MSSIPSPTKTLTEQPVQLGPPETARFQNGKQNAETDNEVFGDICDSSLNHVNHKNHSEDQAKTSLVVSNTSHSDKSVIHAIDSPKNKKNDSITDQDKKYSFHTLQQGQDTYKSNTKSLEPSLTASVGKQKKSSIPSPLNLPKRFVKPQPTQQYPYPSASNNSTLSSNKGSPSQREFNLKDSTLASPKISPTNNSAEKITYYQPLPIQQVQQLQQMQAYSPCQQLFYNSQTGQIVYLPVAAPVAPLIQQVSQQPLVVIPQQRQGVSIISSNQQQQQQQQIMYVKGVNGRLIPVITPPSSYPINNPQFRAGSPLNSKKRNDSISPSGSDNKRYKSSTDPKLTSTQEAERMQKQQIRLQTQMHPNLSSEFGTTNISDVFVDNTNIIDSSSNPNTAEDNFDDDSNEKNDDIENQLSDSADSVYSQQEKRPSLQKVIGTLTLGSFTYRYSQTLSGNIAKDKELFDRLTDNAWKACIAKR